ncbi:uncharacterized protein LOC144288027 isoform X1 [Canis aureus]
MLGLIATIACENQMDAVFCVSKNRFARNTDIETGPFLSTAYSSSSYNPLFVTPQLVATGEDSNVVNRRLGLQVRRKWERVIEGDMATVCLLGMLSLGTYPSRHGEGRASCGGEPHLGDSWLPGQHTSSERFYLSMRDTESEAERGRDIGRRRSRLPAGGVMQDSILGLWDHDLNQSGQAPGTWAPADFTWTQQCFVDVSAGHLSSPCLGHLCGYPHETCLMPTTCMLEVPRCITKKHIQQKRRHQTPTQITPIGKQNPRFSSSMSNI